ncbi:MAG: substrate-binding domain-containing protein [Isosphaeraceae bacterium]|nr:substrate-binding domain-containing protein [Isosphaeraceae bacterium]
MQRRGPFAPKRWPVSRPPLWPLFLTCWVAGCDSLTMAPPAAPELSSITRPSETPPRTLELVLGGETIDRLFWAAKGPPMAERRKVVCYEAHLGAGDPPAKQAELIRNALERHVSALIVEPVDAPEVVDALRSAQAQSVPIVLLDHPVPGLGNAGPVTLVALPDFGPSARSIVASAQASAKTRKLPADGRALLLVNSRTDRRSADRVAALRSALKEAGTGLSETLQFTDTGEAIESSLRAKLTADPKITFVFAEEDQGLAAANHLRQELRDKRPFVTAGYFHFDSRDEPVPIEGCAAAVDGNQRGLIARAVDSAVRLANGEKVPDRIEVPLVLCIDGQRPAPSNPDTTPAPAPPSAPAPRL